MAQQNKLFQNTALRSDAPVASSASPEAELISETYVPRTMPPVLGTWSMTATFVICIYLASSATTAASGGPAAFTYLLLGCVTFFIPSLVATAQLGVMFPHEGALYNWTHKAFGGFWSFFSGFCAWFPGVLITASFADLLVSYLQSMNSAWLALPWQQGLTICAVLACVGFISMQRFITVRNIVNVLVGVMLFSNLLIGLSCLVWLLQGHGSATNFSHWGDWSINPGNISLFGLIVFTYIGTEGPLNLAGEMTNSGAIKRHLLWGALIIFSIYMVSTFSVLVVEGQAAVNNPYALVMTVDKVLGHGWGSLTAIGLMGSFLAEGMAYNYVFARLLMVAGLDGRLPTSIAKLNKHRVPTNAIFFQTVLGIIVTLIGFVLVPSISFLGAPSDLSLDAYNVTQAAATLVWAISTLFLFLNIVGCYRRYRSLVLNVRIVPMPVLWLSIIVGVLSCLAGIVDTLWYSWLTQITNEQWRYIVGSLTMAFLFLAIIGSLLANSEAEWEKDTRAVKRTQ
ncbi:APC family permease [Ktedonosporobacter rubrisoli]|nr:APC family permease [Ktedonosporobacter rubrisoli]